MAEPNNSVQPKPAAGPQPRQTAQAPAGALPAQQPVAPSTGVPSAGAPSVAAPAAQNPAVAAAAAQAKKAAAAAKAAQDAREAMEQRLRRDRIFFNNPVIMQGLGLAPLIVAATTFKNSWMLSVAVLLLLTPTRLLGALVSRIVPFRFRGMAYAVSAATVYLGVFWVMSRLFTSADLALLGLYLPLLVVDPIILKRYERAQNEALGTALRKGLITALGYVVALLLLGSLRELLGTGMWNGVTVLPFAPLPLASLPAGGFGVLAVVMVIWRSFAGTIRRGIDPELEAKE